MVLSLVTLATTVPMLATSTIQLQDTAQNSTDRAEADIKTDKAHYFVRATKRMAQARKDEIHDHMLVVHDGKVSLDHKNNQNHHPFSGYFLPYPNTQYDGVVTTINKENMLNWIFIESDTYQVKHGVRAEAQSHLTGPMKLLFFKNGEKRLAFEGWEGFVVVEQSPGQWDLYFDKDNNGLKSKVNGKIIIEVELIRTPLEEYKPTETKDCDQDDQPD